MDKLAEGRAHACMAALVQSGVPAQQLFVTYKGRGGQTKVDFIPCAAADRAEEPAAWAAAPEPAPDGGEGLVA